MIFFTLIILALKLFIITIRVMVQGKKNPKIVRDVRFN